MYEFQYNSCYCLSGQWVDLRLPAVHFNTTLVIVYQRCRWVRKMAAVISIQLLLLFILILQNAETLNNDFNTTLVIVYLARIVRWRTSINISIQLLLLFILSPASYVIA